MLKPLADVLATTSGFCTPPIRTCPVWPRSGCIRPARLRHRTGGHDWPGFDRVNLAAMVQRLLGLGLAKGHGAADWSKRPLPEAWLNYAALDVEVLIELRSEIAGVLAAQNKTDWAAEEFEYLRRAESTPTRRDRWRRTSGLNKVRTTAGPGCGARDVDRARPDRPRPRYRARADSARLGDHRRRTGRPQDGRANSLRCPIFSGPKQRRSARRVAGRPRVGTPDRRSARRRRSPDRAAACRCGGPSANRRPRRIWRRPASALGKCRSRSAVPTENLVSPDLVRRLCWDFSGGPPMSRETVIAEFLSAGGARNWQRALVVPALSPRR